MNTQPKKILIAVFSQYLSENNQVDGTMDNGSAKSGVTNQAEISLCVSNEKGKRGAEDSV